MGQAVLGIAAFAALFASPAAANMAQADAHRLGMRALRVECGARTGAQFDPVAKRWRGSPAVKAAFKACTGG